MSKAKNKFYELTPRQQQEEKHIDIYKMISEQEKTMDSLLNKYKGDTKEERMQATRRQNKTLEIKTVTNQSMNRSVEKSRSKVHSSIVDLPVINTGYKHHSKRKKQKLPEVKRIPYFQQLKDKKYMQKMKEHLTRAYMNDEIQKLQRSRSKKSIQKTQRKDDSRMTIQNMQHFYQREKSIHFETQLNQNKISEKDIPQPLGYIKNVEAENDDVSSDQGDVPLAYYQREFRGAIRNQCLEQTNFLYFSKNQSMKDWTENLLLLFEKHDKELALLRKRCKYLQKFDNSFFSIDIFRND